MQCHARFTAHTHICNVLMDGCRKEVERKVLPML